MDSKDGKGAQMEAFNAVKVKLSDYDVLTTLGTGKFPLHFSISILKSPPRLFRSCQTRQRKKVWRICCYKNVEKSRDLEIETS